MVYPGSLHNHSEYSNIRIRDSINKLNDIMWYAAKLGHEVFALTDHECVSGYVKAEDIYENIKKEYPNFKFIRGNEIYLVRDGLNNENFEQGDKYYHFILLAKDYIGVKQIFELSTRAWHRSYMGKGLRRVPTYYSDLEEIIGANPGHVIGSTACRGSAIGTQLMKYKELSEDSSTKDVAPALYEQIINWCNYLKSIFGEENFYLEFQPSADKEQEYINRMMIQIASEINSPYIITCDAHYKSKDKARIHKAYLNSQDGDREVDAFYATTYLMDTEELESFLTYMSRDQLDYAYKNILKIKNSCEDFTIKRPLKIPNLQWKAPVVNYINPKWFNLIPNLKLFTTSNFEGDVVLAKTIISKLESDPSLQTAEVYTEVNNELQTVMTSSIKNKAHWSAYLLNLRKIIDTCWEAGSIVGPARGSGGGFLLLYLLDIIQINFLQEETKLYPWRFLNPDRVSVLDIDFDISGLKRDQIMKKFREVYGEDRVANVATFGTEKSKAAIQTAARGLGIDNDEAQYLSSLIPSDRGQTRTLAQCFYGDPDKEMPVIKEFRIAMETDYTELWEVAKEIEGLICRCGIHAGGVIFVDEPFTNTSALMRAPDGTIITQYELHDSEALSLIKYDALSVEAMDKIQICIELLQKYGYIDSNLSLKEAYESTIGIYKLDRTSPEMWKMIWDHKILSLFQMEQQSGVQGIALTKPKSVSELAVLNSVIRLMNTDKDGEQPLNMWVRYRKNPQMWLREMQNYGLTAEEINWLSHHPSITDGICESQEGLMALVQEDRLGGNSLGFADKCRKGLAKKIGAIFDECEKEFYKNAKEKGCSERLAHYVWDVLLKVQRGYSFNRAHTLGYSLVALQEMNLAYKYPTIFWNTANLIVNSGGDQSIEGSQTDYKKVAIALNKTIAAGINVSLIDINKSDYSFVPDVENNQILTGMKLLGGLNNSIIEDIISKRPFMDIRDFMKRCPQNKTVMISLIKSGAFDNVEAEWANELKTTPRVLAMTYYINKISEPKARLNLQNFNGLMQRNLIPDDLILQKKLYKVNKYLKANCKYKNYYYFNDEIIYNFCIDELKLNDNLFEIHESVPFMTQDVWDSLYKEFMTEASKWLKEHQEELLKEFNFLAFKDQWDKYAEGSISKWEMDSLCFYKSPHELIDVNKYIYGLSEFADLPEEAEVDYFFKKAGRQIPIYKLTKIIGTVIGKDENKASVYLLTPSGEVATIKFTKQYYANYAKQISEVGDDGKKHVIEKSWFTRGTKLLITGYRRNDTFVAKTYANTPTHQLYKITAVKDDQIKLVHDREKGIVEDES